MRESKRADRAQFDLDKKAEKVANLEAEIEVRPLGSVFPVNSFFCFNARIDFEQFQ